jgi:hypothetical protein
MVNLQNLRARVWDDDNLKELILKQIRKSNSNEPNIVGQKLKKINLRKRPNKSDSSKPTLVVSATPRVELNFFRM